MSDKWESVILTRHMAPDTGLDQWLCWKQTGHDDGIVHPAFSTHTVDPSKQQKRKIIPQPKLLLKSFPGNTYMYILIKEGILSEW